MAIAAPPAEHTITRHPDNAPTGGVPKQSLASPESNGASKAALESKGVLPLPVTLANMEADAKNVEEVQRKALQRILEMHAGTEYLSRYGFDGSTTVEEFRARHPLTRYEHFVEYIEREAKGESARTGKKILLEDDLTGFMLSSGSSKGSQKKLPRTAGWAKSAFGTMGLYKDIKERNYGARSDGEKLLSFVHIGRLVTLDGGLEAGSATSLLLRDMLKHPDVSKTFRSPSPKEVFGTSDATQAMYCHLLCGLSERESVTELHANFLIHMVSGIQFLQKHWESLVYDLRNGTVSPEYLPDGDLRKAVEAKLAPQPENASVLEAEFRKGFDGIVPRIFPAVTSVQAVCTGSMLQYVPAMERYAGPNIRFESPFYMASEASIGVSLDINVHPRDVAYCIIPQSTFWEFLPVDSPGDDQPGAKPPVDSPGEEQPDTKLLHELEEGRSYEIVLTNTSGLYRYRLEDVVKATGFWHGLAKMQYEYRRGTLQISAQSEKVTEKDLARGVAEAERHLPAEAGKLMDYTVAIDSRADPVRYTVFVELDGDVSAVTRETLRAFADAFERSMATSNPDYVHYRGRSQIGFAEIGLVKEGTFDELKRWKTERGTDVAQYKVPRCLKTEEQRTIFSQRLLRSSANDSNWVSAT